MTDSKTIDDYLELAAQHVERVGLAAGRFVLVEEDKEITECRACMDGAYAIVAELAELKPEMVEFALKDRYAIDLGNAQFATAETRMLVAITADPSPAPWDQVIPGGPIGRIFRFSDWCAANLPDAEARAAVAAKLRSAISR